MLDRVVVPVMDATGKESKLSQHFGRAPYFAVAEVEADGQIRKLGFQPNTSEHHGGHGRPPDIILGLKPNAVITYGMGPRAMIRFQTAGIAVMKASSDTLELVLDAYTRDELEELTEGCRHARHK